jgi:prevent-host-death family protein
MNSMNVHEAKTHFSKVLREVEEGHTLILCRRNEPIAEIRPIPHGGADEGPRPWGLAKGKIEIKGGFFDELPADIIQTFENPA